MKKMLLIGALLCGMSGLWGAVNVVNEADVALDQNAVAISGTVATISEDVKIVVTAPDTTISANALLDAVKVVEQAATSVVIAGDLIIKGEGTLTTIEENAFAGLTSVGGNLVLCDADGAGGSLDYQESQNTELATVNQDAFPDLITVTGSVVCYQCAITSLIFPALTTVGGDFYAYGNAAMTTLSLPKLTTVGGYFWAHQNVEMTTLSLPKLTTVEGNFGAFLNEKMTTLSLPALTTVGGDFWVNDNPRLSKIPFNLFDMTGLDNVDCATATASLFASNIPVGADRTTLTTAGNIVPATAAAALKRHPQVTVNVPGVARDLSVHISTNYPENGETDAEATQKKHGLLGVAVAS